MKPATPISQAREIVLSVKNLTRPGHYADVSLDIHAGEILGLTGLLGSGRTEFALSLFGMNPPTSGEIRLDGKPLALKTNSQAIDEGIAYVSEDRLTLGLVLEQPISANILITILDKLADRFGLVSEATRRSVAQRWIDDLAIKAPNPDNPVKTLSGGNQQRVVLAKWMATKPRLLILDSPTVGVDIAAKDGIYEIVKALAANGVAVLLISDEIPEVFYHAHRVLIMRQGRLVGECRAARFLKRGGIAGRRSMLERRREDSPPATLRRDGAVDESRRRSAVLFPALRRFRRSHEFWLLRSSWSSSASALSLATDSFLTLQNLFDLLTSNAFVGILAAGPAGRADRRRHRHFLHRHRLGRAICRADAWRSATGSAGSRCSRSPARSGIACGADQRAFSSPNCASPRSSSRSPR